MTTGPFLASAVLAVSLNVGAAEAASSLLFEESGTDVVGTLSGMLDVTGYTDTSLYSSGNIAVDPSNGRWVAEPSVTNLLSGIAVASGPASFGTGGVSFATSYVGTQLDLRPSAVLVASDFAGGAVNGLMTFAGESFASLGLEPGSYEYVLDNDDTFTVLVGSQEQVGPGSPEVPLPSVPLPPGGMLLLSGLGGIAAMKRWKTRTRSL